MSAQTICILSPHTDDGELGCGASVSRFIAEGATIIYVAFSLCKESLPESLAADTLANEAKAANAILGVAEENILLFDFSVRRFTEYRQAILEVLIGLQKKYKPSIVFIPSSTDIHQDHGVIHVEALRAFKFATLYGYEMPWNNFTFKGNNFIKVSKADLEKKLASLAAYQSQIHRTYMQPDFIRSLATVRGVQSGVEFAECFETIRIIQ